MRCQSCGPLSHGVGLSQHLIHRTLSEAAQRGAKTDEVFKRRKRFAPQDGLYRGRQIAAPTNGHIAGGLPLEGKLSAEFKRRLTDEVSKLRTAQPRS